jgi:hypothetical protein
MSQFDQRFAQPGEDFRCSVATGGGRARDRRIPEKTKEQPWDGSKANAV